MKKSSIINNLNTSLMTSNAQFKNADENEFKSYISIGFFDTYHDGPLFSAGSGGSDPKSIEDWQNYFADKEIAFQINSLRQLVVYYKEVGQNSFKESFGSELSLRFEKNIININSFIERWFLNSSGEISCLFAGLDFTEADDDVEEFIYDEEGLEKELIFNNGSHFKFNNDETGYNNLFVLAEEFNELFSGLTNIKESLGILPQNEKQNK